MILALEREVPSQKAIHSCNLALNIGAYLCTIAALIWTNAETKPGKA